MTNSGDTATNIERGALAAWRRALDKARARPWLPPALALTGLLFALGAQFAYAQDVDIPRRWIGFVLGGLLFGAAMLVMSRRDDGEPAAFTLTRRQEMIGLALVMLLAIFFRCWRFYDFPQGLWYDEAVNGLDAMFIIDEDHFTVWRETVQGRSTLYLYLLAGSFKLFGFNVFAFRIVPVVAGVGAVFAFYFLARWLVGPVPALVAAALLACSRWAVTFSRISWEAALVPLLATMALLFFVRALEAKDRLRWFYWFMAGGSLAAGLYTHVSFRFVPMFMLFVLLYIAVRQWRVLWTNRVGLVVYAVSFLIVVYPLASFALANQDKVLERTRTVNVFREIDDLDSREPLKYNIRSTIKMMNISGDRNGRHNVPPEPMLDEITGALFVLGLAVSLWSIRSWRRGSIGPWYVLALVPGALTLSIENPSAIRDIGAIPPIFLLVGMATSVLYRSLGTTRAGLGVFAGIMLLLVGVSVTINYNNLFGKQIDSQFVYDGFTPEFMQVGEIIADEANDAQVYVSREFDPHPAVRVLGRGKTFFPYTVSNNFVFPDDGRDVLLLPDERQFGVIETLKRLYPNLSREDYVDPYGRVFFGRVRIPAADIAASHQLPLTVSIDGGPTESRERQRIDENWSDDDIGTTVTWEGFLWSPGNYGATSLRVLAPGATNVELDGRPLEAPTGDGFLPPALLPPGEHAVRITMLVERAGALDLSLETEFRGVLPAAEMLYATSAGNRGFRAAYRTGIDFTTEPDAVSRMPFAAPADAYGTSRSIEYQGVLDVTQAGNYGFGLDSGVSAQLFVDGVLTVDLGGAHPPIRRDAFVALGEGEHLISIQYTVVDRPIWSLYLQTPADEAFRRADGSEFRVPEGGFEPTTGITVEQDAEWGARGLEGIGKIRAVAVAADGTLIAAAEREIAFVTPAGDVTRVMPVDATDIGDIAVADDGRILVLDRAARALLILAPDGTLERKVEGFASTAGVGASGSNALVASPAGGVVYRVQLDTGVFEQHPASAGDMVDRALQPADVAAAFDGAIFIADFESRSIVKSLDGVTVKRLPGVTGTGEQIPRLTTIGLLTVIADPVNQRIVVYDRAGVQRGVFLFPQTLRGTRPSGIATAPGFDGVFYAADLESGAVYRFRLIVPQEIAAALPQE